MIFGIRHGERGLSVVSLLVYLHIWAWNSVAASTLANWPELGEQAQVAVRSQRDLARPIPVDQVTTFGVSLNQLVFEKSGYSLTALEQVTQLLNVNVQVLMVDLYWNEFIGKWQLCPAPLPNNVTQNMQQTSEVSWRGKEYRCQPALTPTDLMNRVYNYIVNTNTNMKVNLVQLLFNLKSISYSDLETNTNNTNSTDSHKHKRAGSSDIQASIYTSPNSAYLALGNSSLNASIGSLGSYLFTPLNLQNFLEMPQNEEAADSFYNQTKGTFPDGDTFLLYEYKRALSIVTSNDLAKSNKTYNITHGDRNNIFLPDNTKPSTVTQLETTHNDTATEFCHTILDEADSFDDLKDLALRSRFRFMADSNDEKFTNTSFRQYVRCGYSPILNASDYNTYDRSGNHTRILGSVINKFFPLSFWSWAVDQPRSPTSNNNSSLSVFNDTSQDDDDANKHIKRSDRDDSQIAYKCVVIDEEGWKLANCYSSHHYACKHDDDPIDWYVDDAKHKQYFESYTQDSCPDGYSFGVPRSSIESLALVNHINQNNISYPVWIDMNDITVTNCFVTGGPYAECPYQKTITKSTLARLVAPSFVVAVLILSLWFLEKFIRVNPIQTNRKRHWKRVLNEYYKQHDYEGVPL